MSETNELTEALLTKLRTASHFIEPVDAGFNFRYLLDAYEQAIAEVAALRAERDALRARVATLKTYAAHLPRCGSLKPKGWGDDPWPCSCGYDAALAPPARLTKTEEEQ